jgi:hypothetical protein
MLTSQSVALLGSFAFTLSLLIFGSRFIVDKFGLFPPDPLGDPTSFKNTLHHAWGSPSASKGGLFSATMSQKIATGDFGDLKEYLAPMGFAVVLGLGAIFSFVVFGKSKSESSYIQRLIIPIYLTLVSSPEKPVLDSNVWKEFTLIKKTAVSHNTAMYGVPLFMQVSRRLTRHTQLPLRSSQPRRCPWSPYWPAHLYPS